MFPKIGVTIVRVKICASVRAVGRVDIRAHESGRTSERTNVRQIKDSTLTEITPIVAK